ncbi:tetratricopeptide repeat-containing sulfotransferase family protein [Pseudoroseicyclus aestuarii]|uniref:Flp pilus assembly protein TadD n=1 Tax=Pseudoroseicyclus aestuarii TaxID=1795041 RepID=A0A318SQY4_9RHOB|nr:sulfotransferase family protein [Pseudoroseicyclus aestuarii]PYE84073.1 Flp pilus assembly protein TadD [Pseudoroseicyclus aestuarii]
MAVRADLRRAEQAMKDSPVQGVLACMAILGRHPANGPARAMLRAMDGAQRRQVLSSAAALGQAGHWQQALALLQPLSAHHPADPALALAEAQALGHLGLDAQVPARLAAPRRAHPDDPDLMAQEALARFRAGETAQAEALLARAAPLRPGDGRIANNLGLMRQVLGDLAGAEQAFRAAVSGKDRFAGAWLNLAALTDLNQEPALRAALEGDGRDAQRPDMDREMLAFALADTALHRGDLPEAFARLETGNALHRQSHPHDEAALAARVRAMADRLPPGFATQAQPCRVVLIVGMPRSGTTLLERILDAHPMIEGLGEQDTLTAQVPALDSRLAAWTPEALNHLGRTYMAALTAAARGDAPVLVDKMPGNALVAGFALAALPEARVIHIRRDPIACAASIWRMRFSQGNDFAYAMEDIATRSQLTEAMMQHWKAVFPDRIQTTLYEVLTARPEAETRRILTGLGLPADPACLSYSGATGEVRTASAHQVRQPIWRSAPGSWRSLGPHVAPLADLLQEAATAHERACAEALAG